LTFNSQQLHDSKQKILEIASRMFAERGYANVSIRDICKEAGVTPPMIYYYFRNKKGLFQAVTKHKVSMKEFIERLRDATGKGNIEERVRAFNKVYLSSFPEEAFRVGFYIKDDASLDKESAKKVAEGFDEIMNLIEEVIQEGLKKASSEGQMQRLQPI